MTADCQSRLVPVNYAESALNQAGLLVVECLLSCLHEMQYLQPVSVLKLLPLLHQMRYASFCSLGIGVCILLVPSLISDCVTVLLVRPRSEEPRSRVVFK